jgi:hypothetical protein
MSRPARLRRGPSIEELLPLLPNNGLGFFYGRERVGDLVAGDLQEDAPLLILGAVGTGKTLLLASILRQLYAANGPERLQVTFIDPDRGLAPLFESRPQTRRIAVHEGDFLDALILPFEETGPSETPYQLLVVDELMWLAPHGPFQEQWQRFGEVLTHLSEDEGLCKRVGLLATSIIGTQETNARFSSTVYIPRDFPFSLQLQLEGEPWLERLVRKYRRGNLFIKRSGQDYRLFRAPFLSVSGPPSVPDLCWGP